MKLLILVTAMLLLGARGSQPDEAEAIRVTDLYEKRGGRWQVVWSHASARP